MGGPLIRLLTNEETATATQKRLRPFLALYGKRNLPIAGPLVCLCVVAWLVGRSVIIFLKGREVSLPYAYIGTHTYVSFTLKNIMQMKTFLADCTS